MDPASIGRSDDLCHSGTAQNGREPQLIATGYENAGRLFAAAGKFRIITILTACNINMAYLTGAYFRKYFFVAFTRIVKARRGRNDDNFRIFPT